MSTNKPEIKNLFFHSAQNAAAKNNPAQILEIVMPLIIFLNQEYKDTHPDTNLNLDLGINLSMMMSFYEANNGKFSHLQQLEQLSLLNMLSNCFVAFDKMEDSDFQDNEEDNEENNGNNYEINVGITERHLTLAFNLINKTIDFTVIRGSIDTNELFGREQPQIKDPAYYFSPRETVDFMRHQLSFIKKNYLPVVKDDKDLNLLEVEFDKLNRQLEDSDIALQSTILKSLKNISIFLKSLENIMAKFNSKDIETSPLMASIHSAANFCDSFGVEKHNHNLPSLRLIKPRQKSAKIIPFRKEIG